MLNFCANNYLGLSVRELSFTPIVLGAVAIPRSPLQSHPEVLKAGAAAFATHGAGLSSVRFICGTQDIHKVGMDIDFFIVA